MRDPASRFGKASIDGGRSVPLTTRPVADPWVGLSLLRKAIRRGGRAERAAIPLYRQQGRGNWRRFLAVAFEDAGVASVEVLVGRPSPALSPRGERGSAAISARCALSSVRSAMHRRTDRSTA